jgi:hypothetical protein
MKLERRTPTGGVEDLWVGWPHRLQTAASPRRVDHDRQTVEHSCTVRAYATRKPRHVQLDLPTPVHQSNELIPARFALGGNLSAGLVKGDLPLEPCQFVPEDPVPINSCGPTLAAVTSPGLILREAFRLRRGASDPPDRCQADLWPLTQEDLRTAKVSLTESLPRTDEPL